MGRGKHPLLPEVAAEGLIGSMREGGSKTGGGGGWEAQVGHAAGQQEEELLQERARDLERVRPLGGLALGLPDAWPAALHGVCVCVCACLCVCVCVCVCVCFCQAGLARCIVLRMNTFSHHPRNVCWNHYVTALTLFLEGLLHLRTEHRPGIQLLQQQHS